MSKTQLVIHHDDLGASRSAHLAFPQLWDAGQISSGSVMVPCAWFPEIAAMARAHPEYDLGVHLTLTSEFELFRWRPLTGVRDNGLCDADGFFWRDVISARRADLVAVEAELRAQIDTALAAGIDMTHLDAHMGTMWYPEFVEIYEKLGADYNVPIVLARDRIAAAGGAKDYAPLLARLEQRGNPIYDAFVVTPFGNLDPKLDDYRAIFETLKPGLSYGAFHFAASGDIEMVTPDATTRIGDYEVFRSGAVKQLLAEMDIEMVGMRAVRDAMRGV